MLARNWSFERIIDSACCSCSCSWCVRSSICCRAARRTLRISRSFSVSFSVSAWKFSASRVSSLSRRPGCAWACWYRPSRRVAATSSSSGSATWRVSRRATSSASAQPIARMNGVCSRCRCATYHDEGVAMNRLSCAGTSAASGAERVTYVNAWCRLRIEPAVLVPCSPVLVEGRRATIGHDGARVRCIAVEGPQHLAGRLLERRRDHAGLRMHAGKDVPVAACVLVLEDCGRHLGRAIPRPDVVGCNGERRDEQLGDQDCQRDCRQDRETEPARERQGIPGLAPALEPLAPGRRFDHRLPRRGRAPPSPCVSCGLELAAQPGGGVRYHAAWT